MAIRLELVNGDPIGQIGVQTEAKNTAHALRQGDALPPCSQARTTASAWRRKRRPAPVTSTPCLWRRNRRRSSRSSSARMRADTVDWVTFKLAAER